jgi:hypothetical protein
VQLPRSNENAMQMASTICAISLTFVGEHGFPFQTARGPSGDMLTMLARGQPWGQTIAWNGADMKHNHRRVVEPLSPA